MVRQRQTRSRLADQGGGGGNYFASPSPDVKFVSTGCTTLDCVLGGGWPLGRVVNVVGDESSGKTLLAIEAMTNFTRQYKSGRCRYNESEAAFISSYAGALGLPLDKVQFVREEGDPTDTVEKFYDDLDVFIKKLGDRPGFYVLDSLDALSDAAELERDFGEGTYAMNKAKQMSQLFRRITSRVEQSNVCLFIVSQTRAKVNVAFGRKYTRAGGKSLNFYASIVLYLQHIGELKRTVKGAKRTVGVQIAARTTKNKVGLPFRGCEFPIVFAYGVEDITAGLDWLHENKRLGAVGLTLNEYKDLRKTAVRVGLTPSDREEWRMKVSEAVTSSWREIETSFLPKRGKYV